MTTRTPITWQETLSDSVDALASAAWEYRVAFRSAEIAAEVMTAHNQCADGASVVLHDADRIAAPRSTRRPHRQAVRRIAEAQGEHRDHLGGLFRQAALTYAYGATWALVRVVAGEAPERTEVVTDHQELFRAFPEGPSLAPCSEPVQAAYGDVLQTAFDELLTCQNSYDLAEDLADRDKVSEQEAAEMFTADRIGEKLPEAAYGYGQLARNTLAQLLHFGHGTDGGAR